ncbi:iron/zinc purple acid phosphatase-like protein [Capsaspora owczarzaki ATCC 30864]|uniref:Purple acid phosphatase n=1 Tax=Capsaspora owczarzaki (strain ATCC 30864) TaxID=595528 RepID=A0A0D2WX61_CAPO3|nr:iron/zinc purple acid phosphatase-like protein [Capsaspora owczarzaki ATCC 30864]KJE97695.1 iron/zinc purple acid phosphatase-like protein [Capsaspora owczarzaki ATCC 30864]|eukprot:XP_004342873.1 iron/zinc purple acid phosphatase-like protein [Capsaspora owczarzaki ATCC 30864]
MQSRHSVVALLVLLLGTCALGAKLEQVHIAFGDTPSAMTVMAASDAMPAAATVLYGTSATALNMNQPASDVRFFTAGNELGLQYHLVFKLQKLVPDTLYFYQVRTDTNATAVFHFVAQNDNLDHPANFLVYGDFGLPKGGFTLPRLVAETKTGKFDAAIHVGDFAYDMFDHNGTRGDNFMNQVQQYAAYLPLMTAVGNHETAFNFSHYRNRFAMPGNGAASDNMYFSWDMGRAHFIAYSSEVFFTNGPVQDQYNFLKQDLIAANANRAERPWIIAYGHQPFYCSNLDHDDCTTSRSVVRAGLEDLFFEYGVDLVIEAHEHSYERLWPVYNETVTQHDYINPRAPVHIIAGVAGCNEGETTCINPILGSKGPWSAFRTAFLGAYGYGRLEITNSTHLHWEQVLDITRTDLDQMVIVQENHGPYKPL